MNFLIAAVIVAVGFGCLFAYLALEYRRSEWDDGYEPYSLEPVGDRIAQLEAEDRRLQEERDDRLRRSEW